MGLLTSLGHYLRSRWAWLRQRGWGKSRSVGQWLPVGTCIGLQGINERREFKRKLKPIVVCGQSFWVRTENLSFQIAIKTQVGGWVSWTGLFVLSYRWGRHTWTRTSQSGSNYSPGIPLRWPAGSDFPVERDARATKMSRIRNANPFEYNLRFSSLLSLKGGNKKFVCAYK